MNGLRLEVYDIGKPDDPPTIVDPIPDGTLIRIDMGGAMGFVPPPFARIGDRIRFIDKDGVVLASFYAATESRVRHR